MQITIAIKRNSAMRRSEIADNRRYRRYKETPPRHLDRRREELSLDEVERIRV